ncbi:MAG: acetyltransferase [Gammaproteobacteria bacterium]|nr:MAG: acetyltransferase [Gammaproteobacteria bacterium]
MAIIDVFNGDADGICALHQLRLAQPAASTLITGVKRDISLVKQVQSKSGDEVTVLDISLDKNRDELLRVLETGASVTYFDHHFAGDIPEHDNLQANIDTDANVCTSLLVNASLNNQFLPWAVTAAYGDNLFSSAEEAAKLLGLSSDQLEQLKELGTCINYNGYGASLDDLIYTPVALYELIKPYSDPFDFINNESGYQRLRDGYYDDVKQAEQIAAEYLSDSHALFILPNEKWARRVSGVFANSLAQKFPARAHAMLTEQSDGAYLVSVRAPLENKTGADDLCRQFPTGGGRKAAAGINKLPADQMKVFTDAFTQAF